MIVKAIGLVCTVLGMVFGTAACAVGQKGGGRVMRFEAIVLERPGQEHMSGASIDSIELDFQKKIVAYGGGTVTTLDVCSDRNWYCLSDGYIEFAVPLDCCVSQSAWAFRGIDYAKLEGKQPEDDQMFIVASPQESRKQVSPKIYRYSKSRGLTGIFSYIEAHDGTLFPAMYVLK